MLVCCVILPILDRYKGQSFYTRRWTVIYLAFAPVFVLLSISYETLFYFSFSNLLFAWLLMERNKLSNLIEIELLSAKRSLSVIDLDKAFAFLLLSLVALYGPGNNASISSYSLEGICRFLTVFDPVLMGLLVILKVLIPLFLLSAVYGIMNTLLALPSFSLFLLVLSTTDIMTLNFFFLVRDEGNWMNIGNSISHYIIASSLTIFQILVYLGTHALVGGLSKGSKIK